ncbi:hypothetical protein CJF30_00011028 [Rutstroemia sp. NJR-2017a BBW]|nr:hypothetical protein CJF30_00011028 [Rutstroemia sp. NJR-2017a BBW]
MQVMGTCKHISI